MNLPPSADEIARIIGLGATMRLVDVARPDRKNRRQAGHRIRVPIGAMGDDHPLVRAIGRESAEMLHRSFAGETLPFPATRMKRFARYLAIAREFQQGIPIPVLAERHGVCLRTVERALDRVTHGDLSRAGGATPPLTPPGLGPSPGVGVRV